MSIASASGIVDSCVWRKTVHSSGSTLLEAGADAGAAGGVPPPVGGTDAAGGPSVATFTLPGSVTADGAVGGDFDTGCGAAATGAGEAEVSGIASGAVGVTLRAG